MVMTSIDWKERAERHRGEVKAARDRLHRARLAGGYSSGGPDAKKAVTEAVKVVTEENERQYQRFEAAPPSPSYKPRSRVVPESYIAVHAKVLLGIEAELAMALEQLAAMRADDAESRAARLEISEHGVV